MLDLTCCIISCSYVHRFMAPFSTIFFQLLDTTGQLCRPSLWILKLVKSERERAQERNISVGLKTSIKYKHGISHRFTWKHTMIIQTTVNIGDKSCWTRLGLASCFVVSVHIGRHSQPIKSRLLCSKWLTSYYSSTEWKTHENILIRFFFKEESCLLCLIQL